MIYQYENLESKYKIVLHHCQYQKNFQIFCRCIEKNGKSNNDLSQDTVLDRGGKRISPVISKERFSISIRNEMHLLLQTLVIYPLLHADVWSIKFLYQSNNDEGDRPLSFAF